ncbi:Methyltransf-21 domain-containing protein [Aphelenchoides besseyi]|nr:Methyltransf-21 domain-containing protein [Aphelenchoides besseyi]KAI6200834.1 Methyltransf-21 domain-containing protein [Aphelenchoides besseyi]
MFNVLLLCERKYFLDFLTSDEQPCNFWTLGIGGDFSGETTLHNRWPQCQITGVDPEVKLNRKIVERVPKSRFIAAAVAENSGTYKAMVKDTDRKYKEIKIPHRQFTEFMNEHNRKERTIDLMIIDVEGAEFGIMRRLIKDKDKLPIICQANMEIHYPPEDYGVTNSEAFQVIHDFLADGTYSIYTIEANRRLMRVFLVNTKEEECVRKFFC